MLFDYELFKGFCLGLSNASAVFQELMSVVLQGCNNIAHQGKSLRVKPTPSNLYLYSKNEV